MTPSDQVNNQARAQSNELERYLEANPGTRFMDILGPDINGVLRGKRIQSDEFAKLFGEGTNSCSATPLMNTRGESTGSVVYGAHDGDPDIYARAVAGSLAPVPWATLPTAQCLVELYGLDGSPHLLDPRHALRSAMAPLKEMGLHPVMATELEFYLVEHDGVSFRPRLPRIPGSNLDQPGFQYAHFDDLVEIDPFLVDLDDICARQNIPVGATLSEYSAGQFEVNLHHVSDPLLACDHAVLLKRAVKAAARRNGLAATFMAKPFQASAGSGLHVHVSLLDDAGNNVFAGKSRDGEFSDTLRYAIGGMSKLMNESMAIFAANANSYRRYAPGFYAPTAPLWGPNHRDLALRIPASGAKNRRVEHRVAGADANPYLVVACILAGIHHGISNEVDPGPMIPEGTEVDFEPTLPLRWSKALDIFEAGKDLPRYLGEHFHEIYGICRREESDLFNAEVSNRDYEWYLRNV
jgi:glutamine synthetase